MKLSKVRIRDYKCIEDSGEFAIGPVTCFVGKNESGKTAILQALHRLNPVEEDLRFEDLEYPRSKWQPNQQPSDLPTDVIHTTWELDDADIEAIESAFGVNILESRTVTVTRGYDNQLQWQVSVDESRLVSEILGHARLSAPEANPVRHRTSIRDMVVSLRKLETRTEKQQNLLNHLQKNYRDGRTDEMVAEILADRLPVFLYFSDYYILPGQVAMDAFMRRKDQNQLKTEDEVFTALLSLAGTTPEAIHDIQTFERLRASLEAVSNRLSKEIFEYWSQNAHLEVVFSFDHARPQDPEPFNAGYVFRTAIKNQRHRATVSFDERSSGFVWFFSFLTWFSQVRDIYGEQLVILLDEPALNLHARAQADFLRYINERLVPLYQVFYTTHSPFMVDPDNLTAARIVEDVVKKERDSAGRVRERLLGTKVREDVLAVDPDTISPLQGAIGYDITQTLFIGKHNLVVEGPSDLLYLNWFSHELAKLGRESLDRRWTICPVGGVDKVASFAALFAGNRLDVAVLTDFHKGQKGKVRSLLESDILKAGHVFTCERFTDRDEGDIEDMIGRDNYIFLVNECYSLEGAERIDACQPEVASACVLEDVEKHMATVSPDIPEFNHYSPALFLTEKSEELRVGAPDLDSALERFERFFREVNQLLPVEDQGLGRQS